MQRDDVAAAHGMGVIARSGDPMLLSMPIAFRKCNTIKDDGSSSAAGAGGKARHRDVPAWRPEDGRRDHCGGVPERRRSTSWYKNTLRPFWPKSSLRPGQAYPISSKKSSMPFSNAAYWSMVFCACVAPNAPMRSSWPFPVRSVDFVPPVAPGAWQRKPGTGMLPAWRAEDARPPTWSITSSPGAGAAMGALVSDPASLSVRFTSPSARACIAESQAQGRCLLGAPRAHRPPCPIDLPDSTNGVPTHRGRDRRRHAHPAFRLGSQSE